MLGSPSSNGLLSRFDLLVQPFRLLRIDPAATTAEVQAAYALALDRREAPEQALADARSAILDLPQRLTRELAFPIDTAPAQVETIYAELSKDNSEQDLLLFSDRLAPLSRANFISHLAARRSAGSAMLVALMDSHASIDAIEIYATLKALRSRAGFPTPSLVSVSQGLQDLFVIHDESAIAGFDPIQSAAEPLLKCAQHILATSERYRIEALSGLMQAYRRSTTEPRSMTDQGIESACEALQQRPDDMSSIERLTDALRHWISLCGPLIVLAAHQRRQDRDLEIAVDHVRLLLASLDIDRHAETAQKVMNLARSAFNLLPGSAEKFNHATDTRRNHLSHSEHRHEKAAPRKIPFIERFGKRAMLVCSALVGALCVFIAYRTFDSAAWRFFAPASDRSGVQTPTTLEPDIVPPVGSRQRFGLDYVRYCLFQEERLRLIKQQVQGPDDIKAFNVLANDYNSRCSDFFYLDDDLKVVKDEVNAKKKALEADAKRILASWPWHPDNGGKSPPLIK